MLDHYGGTKRIDHFPSLYKLQFLLQLPILAWPQIRFLYVIQPPKYDFLLSE